jgi:hypothetical protein
MTWSTLIKDNGLRLLSLYVVRGRCTERRTRTHVNLVNSQEVGEGDLHLGVVHDGFIEVLNVLGMIIRKAVC